VQSLVTLNPAAAKLRAAILFLAQVREAGVCGHTRAVMLLVHLYRQSANIELIRTKGCPDPHQSQDILWCGSRQVLAACERYGVPLVDAERASFAQLRATLDTE